MADWSGTRHFLPLVLVTAASLLSLFVLRSYHDWDAPADLRTLPENVDLALEDLVYSKNRDGRRLWVLEARRAEHTLAGAVTRIDGLRMVFFDPKQGEIVLTAEQGELQVRTNVVLTDHRGLSVRTRTLEYVDTDRSLQTDDPVTILSGGLSVTGTGLRIDTEQRRMTVGGRVRAVLAAPAH
jgi:LPS export ABC transporter protein LptC